jgi:hypothetical protein
LLLLSGDDDMAKTVSVDSQYCVKVQIWENGFLKKTISKEFFEKESDAERYYNSCEQEGTKVQLSKYIGGNERTVKVKNN